MAKEQLINRAKYKDIKRYDHNQMEIFARSLYEQGVKHGAEQTLKEVSNDSKEQMDLEIFREKILQIKGIGQVKADAIVEIVREML